MPNQHPCSTAVRRAATALLIAAFSATAAAETPIAQLLADAPNNWHRWGDEDSIGALNYLDEEQTLRGIKSVRSGKRFTLQIPMTHGHGPVFPGRTPTLHFMTQDESVYGAQKAEALAGGVKYSDDVAFIYLQGTTHVDGLAHAWYGDQVWGGKSADTTVHGHTHGDVSALGEHGIIGRGVLLDVGRHLGGDDGRLAPDSCVTLDDLKATAKAQKVKLAKRDILVLRTGSIARFYDDDPEVAWDGMTEPGLCYSAELVEWVHDMEIPAIAADNLAVERVVQEIDGETFIIPLHAALMRNLGVVLTEIYWLEDLARDSAADGQYDFLFVAAPLKMVEGTGSPVNPVAIK